MSKMSCQGTYTLYGSRGSDVKVILNVTLDLKKRKYLVLHTSRCRVTETEYIRRQVTQNKSIDSHLLSETTMLAN